MRVVPVSNCLDKKLYLFGFEIFDLTTIFMLLSMLQMFFGRSSLSFLLVWPPPIVLAVILRCAKRNKPHNYLVHWLRYQIKPGVYSAFKESKHWEEPPTLKRRTK